jgi:hypothetical protein
MTARMAFRVLTLAATLSAAFRQSRVRLSRRISRGGLAAID